jgi:eukaryotic-like serine/threonine-protein kinase
MYRLGIAGRVFIVTATIVCTVLAAALAVASRTGRRTATDEMRRDLDQSADLTAQHLTGRGRSLAGGARVFVQGPNFHSIVASSVREDILDQALEAQVQLGADWVFITDERGMLIAKTDEPGVRDVPMADIPLVRGALEGRNTSGFGVSRDTLLFQAVAVPIVPPGAAPVGVLVATRLITDSIARDVRATAGAEVVFYTLDLRGAPHVAATSFPSPAHAAAALPAASALPATSRPTDPSGARDAQVGDTTFALQGAALTTAGSDIVGGFVVARPTQGMAREIAGVRRSLVLAGALGLVLALIASWSAARHVTRPARALATAAERARDGDYDGAARAALAATERAPRDEIAALGGALTALLEELREKQALVAMLGGAVATNRGHTESADDVEPPAAPVRPRVMRGRSRAVPAARELATPWSARVSGAVGAGAVVADRYAIESVVGSGGTGIVYKATDLTLNEVVALKMLRPEIVADDPRARDELKHELRLARRVSHRNVVRTHDFGSSRGAAFITMEYVEGPSLGALLAHRGALPHDVVLSLARQLLRGLEAAHEQGVMHGDLKPANLLVALDGLLKITDFGQSTLARRPRPATGESVKPPHLAGAVVGTPEYMAPEQLLGGSADVRTDLYAAGMVLHECLTGETPFPQDTPRRFLARKLDTPVRGVQIARFQQDLRTLDGVVGWMTATDEADRPVSAAAVGATLARLA